MAEKAQESAGRSVGVDLGSLDVISAAEGGAWLVPTHPATGEVLEGCRVLVYGMDSRQYAKAMNRIADLRADRQRTRRKTDTNFDDIQAAELILAVYLTAKWEGLQDEGKTLKCDTPDKVKNRAIKEQTYTKHRWLAEQVVEFARDRANFIES
jgi:hypothetical protein